MHKHRPPKPTRADRAAARDAQRKLQALRAEQVIHEAEQQRMLKDMCQKKGGAK